MLRSHESSYVLEADLFLLFVRLLNRAGIRYMIGGSVASIYFGEPRLTHDVDFVVFLRVEEVPLLVGVFPESEFYVPPSEMIKEEVLRERGHFNVIHEETGFKADFYPAGRDELNAWGFRFRRETSLSGEPVVLAPPEYVIVRKLEYFRDGGSDKHLRDIRSMLAISGDQIDRTQLQDWIARLDLRSQWEGL